MVRVNEQDLFDRILKLFLFFNFLESRGTALLLMLDIIKEYIYMYTHHTHTSSKSTSAIQLGETSQ